MMDEVLAALRQRRMGILLVNLLYFLALLALGVLFFLKGAGGVVAYALAALCVASYLLLVRPMQRRYTGAVREAVIRHTVCAGFDSLSYEPRDGVTAELVQAAGLFPDIQSGAFISREHVTGQAGPIRAELADVTFPIVEDGLNTMFSGAFVELVWPGAALSAAVVRAGDVSGIPLPKQQLALAEALGELIPGSLYLCSGGEKLTLLLRGRFLGFPINPLLPADRTLLNNPFPEMGQAIRLVRLMGRADSPSFGQSKEKGVENI